MFDYLKMALVKPLEAIVIALCVGYLFMHVELFKVEKAQAEAAIHFNLQQVVNAKVVEMNETLIRIDENVKQIKEVQAF